MRRNWAGNSYNIITESSQKTKEDNQNFLLIQSLELNEKLSKESK